MPSIESLTPLASAGDLEVGKSYIRTLIIPGGEKVSMQSFVLMSNKREGQSGPYFEVEGFWLGDPGPAIPPHMSTQGMGEQQRSRKYSESYVLLFLDSPALREVIGSTDIDTYRKFVDGWRQVVD